MQRTICLCSGLPRADRGLRLAAAVALTALVATGCGASAGARAAASPARVVDVALPTPGTAALPTDRAGFESELADLAGRLAQVPDGAAAVEEDALSACLRLSALARGFAARTDQTRVGLLRIEHLQLKGLERECPTRPRAVSRDLRGLLGDAGLKR